MDDEALVRDIARRMLTKGGYEVASAADGAEAIEMCARAIADGRPFDAAILDVTVQGGMGGRETLARLRALQPGLAVVLSSGYAELGVSAGDCQPTAVLPKPYQMHELLACARAVVSPSATPYS
jgi:CheY-like chemotaxis protein